MARELATTKETGGGGFSFADKVAAWFLLQMLRRTVVLAPEDGAITEVQFETRESGWLLDDLLLVLGNDSGPVKCGLSVKSDRKLSRNGLDSEFVRDAWEQWRGVPGATFDRDRDYLGLATGGVSDSVLLEWSELEQQASGGAADRLEARLAASSAIQRNMFESVLPAGTQGTDTAVRVEAARLLSRMRVFNFDFEFAQSAHEREAIKQCSERTVSETFDDGVQLWTLLVGIGAKSRTTGASISVLQLLRLVRGTVAIKDYVDYGADWEKVERRSKANLAEIRTVVGEDIQIEREEERNMLTAALPGSRAVAIVGESGSGKSALLSAILQGGLFERIVWLKPEQLSHPSEPDLTAQLGLRHSLATLVEGSARTKGILVLDSFERFEGNARARAIELVRAVLEKGDVQWKVVLTTQNQSWLPARRALVGAGLVDVKVLSFGKPKPEQIAGKLDVAPGVARLFHRRELQPILCNLAVLHWVVTTERLHPFDEQRNWVGEAELIGWIWEHWRGEARDEYRRDSLLRLIGEKEGERLSGAAALESIPATELGILRDLERDGIVRVTESSVEFSHDLIGDWARFRTLLAAGDEVSARIREKVVVPRWARAVRLYAQGLAERQEGLAKWKAGLGDPTAKSVESALTKDLFLDGIVFAANVEPLLEQVWPELINEKGKLLSRLLARLSYAGTVPDWRMKEEVEPEDADLATAWFRVPNPIYWVPILRVLARHSVDVAKNASFQAAKALELWLRIIPPTFPGRKEAAEVAIELAREMQGILAEGVIVVDEIDAPIYQALLQAAPEFPEEVSELALELAGRRPESERTRERRATARLQQAAERAALEKSREAAGEKRPRNPIFVPLPGESRGTPTIPASDGPNRRVESGFRSAVLDGPALHGLVMAKPEVAREVLLAVCLEAPRDRDDESPFSLPGFAHWQNAYPPMYWKGPFVNFLKLCPSVGLDVILRLVNYATRQWVRRAGGRKVQEQDLGRFGVEITLNDKTAVWSGNFDVFGWYRNSHGVPNVVACALMAFEKWLYDLMDADQSIDAAVQQIYQENQSLALAGVLIAAGLKQPEECTKVLQPMLGSLHLYFFQSALAQQDSERIWTIGMVGWGDTGKKAFGIAQAWHEMEHRTFLLQNEAVRLMLTDKPSGEYIRRRKVEWEKIAVDAGEDRERLEFFLAKFDPGNYTPVQLEDGSMGFEGRLPAHLESRANEKAHELGLTQLALTLPRLARECLSGEKRIAQDRVGSFFEKVQLLSGYQENEKEFLSDAAVAGVLGGIAVLVVDHREWLRDHPDAERWCLERLRSYESRPAWERTGDNDIYKMAPEGFFGEACVALLPELQEAWVKRGAVRGATALQYQSTAFVMRTAYRLQTKLGADFPRLCNVIVLWAALRRASTEALYSGSRPEVLAKSRTLLADRFVKGKVGTVRLPLGKADRLGTRLVRDEIRRNRPWELEYAARREAEGHASRRSAGVDLEVLRLGFSFLTVISHLPAGQERDELVERCRELLDFEMSMVPKVMDDDETRSHGPIYDFDQWVFELAARVLCLDVAPGTRAQFWRPVLERGVAGHDWIEDFLGQFFRIGLAEGMDPNRVASVWKEMIVFTTQSPEWAARKDRNWYRVETLWSNLMGLGYTARLLGRREHRALVETMLPEYQHWGAAWLTHSGSAVAFAYFLASESGSVLLPGGLPELAKSMRSFRDYEWARERVGDSLSAAVRTAWRTQKELLRANRAFWEAFQAILNELCTRMDSVALQIRAETAEFVAERPQ